MPSLMFSLLLDSTICSTNILDADIDCEWLMNGTKQPNTSVWLGAFRKHLRRLKSNSSWNFNFVQNVVFEYTLLTTYEI